jgi:hypothetical protein
MQSINGGYKRMLEECEVTKDENRYSCLMGALEDAFYSGMHSQYEDSREHGAALGRQIIRVKSARGDM